MMITFSLILSVFSLSVIHKFDYVFAENGTVQYKDGKLFSKHVREFISSVRTKPEIPSLLCWKAIFCNEKGHFHPVRLF